MANRELSAIVRAAGIGASCALAGVPHARADLGDQLQKIVGNAAFDKLGTAVAIDGDVAVVGAPGAVVNNQANHGVARVIDTTTGATLFTLNGSHVGDADRFGWSVAIDGGLAVVGAYGNSGANDPGEAYVFDATTGQQLHRLTAADADDLDQFGWSVSISDGIVCIGARHDSDAAFNTGSAYLFDATTGQQLHKLTPSDGAAGDEFGTSVSVSGDVVIVGSPGADPAGSGSGAAYIFDTSGQQRAKITAADASGGDAFGTCVAVGGWVAVVGAPFGHDGLLDEGAAYVFEVEDPDSPSQQGKLVASDATQGDLAVFGAAVAVDGNAIVVGARYDGDLGFQSGSAYLFHAASMQQLLKVTASDGAADDLYAYAVAISGDTAIIGAPEHDPNNVTRAGAAYVIVGGCRPDINGDGTLNVLDFFAFRTLWISGDPRADFNGDGQATIADANAFKAAFQAGCP